MTVSATNSAANTPAPQDTTDLGRTRLAESFDTFLTLLTAQLKNQDPLSPMDSTQFTQQLVQMTAVEQQLAANDLLKQLVSNTGANVASAVGLIGKEVQADSSDAKLTNGQAQWTYTLEKDAATVTVEVLDSNGTVVKAVQAPTDSNGAGEHTYTWNGIDKIGNKLADGSYTLRVTAKDADGKTVNAGTYVKGVVTSVEELNGEAVITVNGVKVPLSQLTSVTDAAPQTPSGNDNDTPTDPDGSGADNTNNPADQTSAAAA